jgi:oligogalacturonide transport system permease protein
MKKQSLKRRDSQMGILFVSPWIIGFIVFTLFPLVYSIFLSFQNVTITPKGIKTTFVAFKNYSYAFTVDADFVQKLISFLQQLIVSVPIILVFSLIIALLLNQKVRLRGAFRTVFFLPVIIISGPVMNQLIQQNVTSIPNIDQYAIYQYFNQNPNGFINGIMLFLMGNLVYILWFSGVQILIYLAGLQKVDKQIYEAAEIDGASVWESFWKITLPSLFPMILVNTIYTIVTYSVFGLNPIIQHINDNMFNIQTGFGYASALSWIYFIVITLALLIAVGGMSLRGRKTRM